MSTVGDAGLQRETENGKHAERRPVSCRVHAASCTPPRPRHATCTRTEVRIRNKKKNRSKGRHPFIQFQFHFTRTYTHQARVSFPPKGMASMTSLRRLLAFCNSRPSPHFAVFGQTDRPSCVFRGDERDHGFWRNLAQSSNNIISFCTLFSHGGFIPHRALRNPLTLSAIDRCDY